MRQPLLSVQQQLLVRCLGGQELPAADRLQQEISLQGEGLPSTSTVSCLVQVGSAFFGVEVAAKRIECHPSNLGVMGTNPTYCQVLSYFHFNFLLCLPRICTSTQNVKS